MNFERVRDQVAEDLRQLGLVSVERRQLLGGLEDERNRIVSVERAEHPAQQSEEVVDLEPRWPYGRLPSFDPREVEKIVDETEQALAGGVDEADLPFLFVGERAVDAAEEELGQGEHGGERRAQLVAQAREELRLRVARAAELLGTLVELRVQGDDSAVGLLELTVELGELVPATLQLGERLDQLLVLQLQLAEWPGDDLAGQGRRDRGAIGVADRAPWAEALGDDDGCPGNGVRLDLEGVHQPARARDAHPHARWRDVATRQDARQILDPFSLVADTDDELDDLAVRDRVLDLAAARVLERVARQLGDCRGDSYLVLTVEAEQAGHLSRPLAREHHVVLAGDHDRRQRVCHVRGSAFACELIRPVPRLRSRRLDRVRSRDRGQRR